MYIPSEVLSGIISVSKKGYSVVVSYNASKINVDVMQNGRLVKKFTDRDIVVGVDNKTKILEGTAFEKFSREVLNGTFE